MVKSDEAGMWNMVLFDLPVTTKNQRREATRFRKLLIDLGWSMEQFSVYVRYVPPGMSVVPEVNRIRAAMPPQGLVQIIAITDRQWSKAIRFFNAVAEEQQKQPDQFTLF